MSTHGKTTALIRAQYPTFEAFAKGQLEIGRESQKVTNPYSQQAVVLPALSVAVYDYIKGVEMVMGSDDDMQDIFQEAMGWFAENHPDEYFTLLD